VPLADARLVRRNAARRRTPAALAAHTLAEGGFALAIFGLWAAVLHLAFGVSHEHGVAIRAAAGTLATAVVLQLA
jgi:hypothetical protein